MTIKFDSYGLIDIQGALTAAGTASAPITFTSGQATPQPGDWSGVRFEAGARGSLSHATIAYAGAYPGYSPYGALVLQDSSPTLDHLTITASGTYGLRMAGSSHPAITNSSFSGNTYDGINASDTSVLDITGSSFGGNGDSGGGAGVYSSANGVATAIQNDTFTGNAGKAVELGNPNVALGLANNSYSGNGFDGIWFDGGLLTTSETWPGGGGRIGLGGMVTVSGTAALTITAGTTVSAAMISGADGPGLEVRGTLKVLGTATQPITLTGDGPNHWAGIFLEPGSSGVFSYTTISRAGGGFCWPDLPVYCGGYSNNNPAALTARGASLAFDHSAVTDSWRSGVDAGEGSTVAISYATITSNRQTGIVADVNSPLTVAHSTISSNGTGINTDSAATTIHDDAFLDNGYAVELGDPDATTNLAGNTFRSNTFDGVYLNGGTLTTSAMWSPGADGVIEFGGMVTVSGTAALTITAGTTASVAMISGADGPGLQVRGSLAVLGTATQPVTLTGSGPNHWAGIFLEPGSSGVFSYTTISKTGGSFCWPDLPADCGGNGNYNPAALRARGASLALDHTVVTSSGRFGVDADAGSRATIVNSAITQVATALNVDHATVSIHNSVIADDSYGISNCAGCTPVQAQNNYWGTPSGPAPYGSGPGISYHQESYTDPNTGQSYTYNVPDVAVEPWLGEGATLQQHNGPAGNSGSGAGGSSGTAGFGRSGSSTYGGFDAGSALNDTVSFGEPVNTATGSYEYSHTDLSLGGRTPLVFARSYNSRTAASSPGPLGYGWTWTYGIALTAAPAASSSTSLSPTVQVTFGTGRTDLFTQQPDGSYAAAPGQFDALAVNIDGTYDVTDKDGTAYHFSSGGALQSITDRNGNVTSLAYDLAGRVSTVSAVGGRALTLAYNGDGRIASVTDNMGRAIVFAYSAAGDLTGVTDPRGHTTRYAYDAGHQLTSGTDRDGHIFVTNQYDSVDAGRVVTQTDALGSVTTFAYYLAPPDSVTVATDPRGAATTYIYDSGYRLLGVRDALGGTTSYTYDDRGDRLSATDPNNDTWTYTYDARGNETSATSPHDETTTTSYDSGNRPLGVVDPLGHATTYSYDARENPRTRTDALGDTTVYTYTARGDLSQVTDALSRTTTYGYDAAGDRTTVTDALSHTMSTAYDALGRTVAVTDALGHAATVGYDADDDVITRTDALGHGTVTAYDAEGNKTGATDPRGYTTAYAYDADNRLITVTDALSGTTVYGYDATGDRTSVTDALTHTTATAYDLLGRPISTTNPLGETVQYGYDAAGNRTSVVNARGHTTTYSYDVDNRLSGIAYADGTSVAYTYDGAGRRATMVDATGTTTYAYDWDNRPTTITQPNGTVTYSYDKAGDRASVAAPGGEAATYGYDAAGRLASVTDWRGGMTRYGYDAAGRTAAITYTNGITAAYSYDDAGQVRGIAYAGPGGALGSFGYTYDADGNRLTATDGGGTTTYGYDPLDRLTSVGMPGGTTSYAYDAAGNRTRLTTSAGGATAYSYDAADELTAAGGTTYTYDADGNRVTATTNGATTTYGYDDADYLTGISWGAHAAAYTYDGDHARVGSAVDGTGTGYVLDLAAGLPTVLQQATGGVTTTYLYGAGLLGQDDGTGAGMQTLLPDALGSTRLVATDGGAVVGHSSYDAYGAQTASGAGSAFGFTGEQTDAASGLVYLRARYYDPATGVFLQRDPYPFDPYNPVTIDRYTYATADPVNRSDPSGLFVYGLCVNAGAGFILGGSVQICLVSADFKSLGLSGTVAGQVQTGSPSVDAGLQVQVSDDKSISDLSGGSYYAGGSAGAGLDVGVDVSTSTDECGNFSRPSPDVTIGLGAGVEAHAGYSYTQAIDFADLIPKVY